MKKILVVNAGSSTYKLSLFHSDKDPIWKTQLEYQPGESFSLQEKIKQLLEPIIKEIDCVGHRIVHGGSQFIQPVQLTPSIIKQLHQLSPLAPLHNPANLKGIDIISDLLPSIPQIGVFDTAFHATLPEAHYTYAIPEEWRQWGIRRYGFHGLSHAYCSQRAIELLQKQETKIICCHLGNGSSLSAIKNGKCVNTTMGFTPLEGLIMGSRSGSVDPGILLYLQREHQLDFQTIDKGLNYQSGLKGLSGKSDYRELMHDVEAGNEKSKLAYDMLVHSIRSYIGSMLASLEGLDALIFTGGIGENAPELRADVCHSFRFLGLEIDKEKNKQTKKDGFINADNSSIKVLIINTKEDFFIAQACL